MIGIGYLIVIGSILQENKEEIADIKRMLSYQNKLAIAVSSLREERTAEILGHTSKSVACSYMYDNIQYLTKSYSDEYVGFWDASIFGHKGMLDSGLVGLSIFLPALYGSQNPTYEEKQFFDSLVPSPHVHENVFKRDFAYFAEEIVGKKCRDENVSKYTKKKMDSIVRAVKDFAKESE